jgi:acetyl/propionyl-CoA carboxylase alpha subunit
LADPLFVLAEDQAYDLARAGTPRQRRPLAGPPLSGILSPSAVRQRVRALARLDVDGYVAAAVHPSEDPNRPGVRWLIRHLDAQTFDEIEMGPLYAAELVMAFDGRPRRVGLLAQDRRRRNGVWRPEHHLRAVEIIRAFAGRALPIVTIIDTPGADAGEAANRQNQAQSISRLIAEFAQLHVPTVGVILGNGYSGGAIPLATTNLLLSVRDGVFNTIQPRGLAGIARKYDLSWQESARYVGVSSYELYEAGVIDGVIDFAPGDAAGVPHLIAAVGSALASVERAAEAFVASTPEVFEHYRRSVARYLDPSEALRKLQQAPLSLLDTPTEQPNVFGCAFRHLRYLALRSRIRSTTVAQYGRLSAAEAPRGDLRRRVADEYDRIFGSWLANPLELRYDAELTVAWKQYVRRRVELTESRGRVGRFFFGDPALNVQLAKEQLLLALGFHLLNTWKGAAQANFVALARHLRESAQEAPASEPRTVLDVIRHPEVREAFIAESESFLLFDLIYDNLIGGIQVIAREAMDTNAISRASVRGLYERSLAAAAAHLAGHGLAAADDPSHEQLSRRFAAWLARFGRVAHGPKGLKRIEAWKKLVHPRVSEPLFAIITFYLERLLPAHLEDPSRGRSFDGRIQPRNIGVRDFWHRLTRAYQDLLITGELQRRKREEPLTPAAILDRFFTRFRESDAGVMSADPRAFPGFRAAIEEALGRGIPACGAITGTAICKGEVRAAVGVILSNVAFQAGAFDMAATEKVCRLLVTCARRRLPVIAFISSGGMQTKEGAGALFPMAVLNDRFTRFVRETGLPVICFGFGDCTGGAQASFVTHPLVQTFYFSGTNMPFAGQLVVPEHLPATAVLSNYLSREPGAMSGLVVDPFRAGLDEALRAIDPDMPIPRESVDEVIARVLRLELEAPDMPAADSPAERGTDGEREGERDADAVTGRFSRVLVHARGCAAEKIVRKAQEAGHDVVLVQSDPDMESTASALLRHGRDQLICIGGNTPAESYLNAMSIIRVAQHSGADALHPGIGFLSENASFARLCRAHGLVFIGPPAESMDAMGHKSNAISTAMRLGIPVVPGSHGIVTHADAAARVAEDIDYPVIIKAVHGGGGKGIAVVESSAGFVEAFLRISAEARSAFGNGDVYLERFVRSLRHVEVQVLRDALGHTKVLGLRDCSVQRNNQKIIEESGSEPLPAALKEALLTHAGRIAEGIGYVGAGTVEFIFDLDRQAVYFMEMNTRLQVEHPVTEAVSGIDIVAAQFAVAAGESIEGLSPEDDGHAMELRINAERAVIDEDGHLQMLPSPGDVEILDLPEEPGITLIRGVGQGTVVTPFYDSMILQVIGHAPTRQAVIELLRRYLQKVTIRGIATNIPLLQAILEDPVFQANSYDTSYLRGLTSRIDAADLMARMEQAAGGGSTLDLEALRIQGTDELRVPAPSAGIFYRTPAPGEPDFVRPGDVVDADRTLCLLEAMKLFRPLNLAAFTVFPADGRFEIVRIVPDTGQTVNRDDLLFVIRPV